MDIKGKYGEVTAAVTGLSNIAENICKESFLPDRISDFIPTLIDTKEKYIREQTLSQIKGRGLY